MTRRVALAALALLTAAVTAAPAGAADPVERVDLSELGFSLTGSPRNTVTFIDRTMLVPTPWGTFDVSLISRPLDQTLRVPLSPAGVESAQPSLLQPYVSAGARKADGTDERFELVRPAAADDRRSSAITAGAGIILRLDPNLELYGEYQFLRVRPELDVRAYSLGGVRTEFDSSAITWGLSIKY